MTIWSENRQHCLKALKTYATLQPDIQQSLFYNYTNFQQDLAIFVGLTQQLTLDIQK